MVDLIGYIKLWIPKMKIKLIFKCTWNIHKKCPNVRPHTQKKFIKFQRIEIMQISFLGYNAIKNINQ